MGLGLWIRCDQSALLGRAREQLEHQIAEFARSSTTDPLVQRLIKSEPESGRLCLRFHPAEEPVEFFLDEHCALVCSAKTSDAGPGYHAFLVDWLDELGRAAELPWEWQTPDGECADETGYYAHRDFSVLQDEMATFASRLAQIILPKLDIHENIMLGMPVHYQSPNVEFCALYSLGFLERERFVQLAAAVGDDLRALAADYFPWWNRSRDAAFWERAARVQAWVDVPWHAPFDEHEAALCALTLDCFDRARELDPAIPLPEAERAELQRLTAEEPGAPIQPAPEGIGFRRHLMTHSVGSDWTIRVPGYWYREFEDDDRAVLFWFGDRTLQVSSFNVTCNDGSDAPPEGLLDLENQPPGALHFSQDHLIGCAEIVRKDPEEIGAQFMLHGRVAMTNQLCILTICYENAADEAWAIETWRSAFHPACDAAQS